MPDEDDIEELRRKRMEELREKKQEEQNAREKRERAVKQQQEAIFRGHTTDEARKRLNNVEMVNEELAQRVKRQIIALAQQGRLREDQKIDDEQMRKILEEAQPDDDGFNIRRR